MSLFYVTMHAAPSTTPANLVQLFHPSRFTSLSAVTHGYLYRANDPQGVARGKPEWMIMYEMAANESKPQLPITIESITRSNPEIKIYRRGLYSLQASRSSPKFPSLDFRTTSNLLVAVFLCIDPVWKEEYGRYYTEEHMDAIAMVPGWRRTRRLLNTGLPDSEVELAQFHDYDLDNGLSGQEFTHATSTKWYKDMMANAVLSKDRRTYELLSVI